MKIRQVRKGTFQTNSSSAHVIVVAPGPLEKGVPNSYPSAWSQDSKQTAVEIQFGEYNWEIDCYGSWLNKASYAATWAFAYGEKSDREMLRDVIMENTPGCTEVYFKNRHDRWELGGGEFFVDDDENVIRRFMVGNIDHQSTEVAQQVFRAGKDELARFIFSENSTLYTGNDDGEDAYPNPTVPPDGHIYGR